MPQHRNPIQTGKKRAWLEALAARSHGRFGTQIVQRTQGIGDVGCRVYPNALAVDGAGRILVLADAGDQIVFRLTASGVLDTSFGGGDGYVFPTGISAPYTFAVDGSTGAMYVGSYCVAGANQFASLVTRLDAAGALDPTFGGDGQVEISLPDQVWFNAMRMQSDGKVVLAGMLKSGSPADQDPALVRLLPNGALDTSFSGDGVRHVSFGQAPDGNEQAHAITLSAGRVVEAGNVIVSGVSRFAITRWTSDLLFTDGFERGTTAGWGAH